MARAPTSDYLVLDIETIPDDQRWSAPEPSGGEPARPSPFPPLWAHRIVVAGYAWLEAYRLARFGVLEGPAAADPDVRERALLAELSALIGRHRPTLVTFNGRGFDLPVIALRALCHGVPLGWYYRDRGVRARH
nr:hypothetical protein [Deltaproteobacteria bacterium]